MCSGKINHKKTQDFLYGINSIFDLPRLSTKSTSLFSFFQIPLEKSWWHKGIQKIWKTGKIWVTVNLSGCFVCAFIRKFPKKLEELPSWETNPSSMGLLPRHLIKTWWKLHYFYSNCFNILLSRDKNLPFGLSNIFISGTFLSSRAKPY